MSNKNVKPENIQLAKYIMNIVGTNPKVARYWDNKHESFLDIFTCDDPTEQGVEFYGTIGLSDYPNRIELKDDSFKNIPIEFLMTGYDKYKEIPNIISTCGFYLSKDQWSCQYGSVFMRMVEMYYPDYEMKHIFFTNPFLWQDKLEPIELPSKTVHWLLGIPISEDELSYRNELGADALNNKFEEENIDIFDLERKSVI